METNNSVWAMYAPGYVHPDFVPYMRYPVEDDQGNAIMLNTWKQNGPDCESINPGLIRKNWGLRFARKFPDDPCPYGFVKGVGENEGYCYQRRLDYDPIFYTDKAFIAKHQHWQAYTDMSKSPRRSSQPTDMRSVNPNTGQYAIYYLPASSTSTQYGVLSTADSYLG